MPRQPKELMPALESLCDVALVHLKNSQVFAGVIPSKYLKPKLWASPFCSRSQRKHQKLFLRTAGLHIAAEDPTALAESVSQLVVNRSALKNFAAAALKAAPSHSRETPAREFINVLKKLLGRKYENFVTGAGGFINNLISTNRPATKLLHRRVTLIWDQPLFIPL